MSRKFRWFLLAACAFVVLMNGRTTFALLAAGPQVQSRSPERKSIAADALDRKPAAAAAAARKLASDAELARGEKRK